MSEKHYIVQGAICRCTFSETPQTDVLLVKSQDRNYINDAKAAYKRSASTKDIGHTFEKNTFGNCRLQPIGSGYKPCIINVTKWQGFYSKKTFEHGGKALIETSTAGCTVGGPDCIVIQDHGQTSEITQNNLDNANNTVLAYIYPFGDLKNLDPEIQEVH